MQTRSLRELLPLYAACYAIWIVVVALGALLIFEVRPVLFTLAVWMRLNPWQVRAIQQFSVTIGGLIWLIWALALEHRLRTGIETGKLWVRAGRAFAIVAIALGLSYTFQALT